MRSRLSRSLLALAGAVLVALPVTAQDFRDRDTSFGSERLYPYAPSPPQGFSPNRWKLGVQVRNLDTGVLITQVAAGSPAEQAGLRAGDTIVNVGGYQVGYVDGRLYDLGDEVAQRVNERGQVLLLFSSREGRLASRRVSMTSSERVRISGQIAHERGRISLSPPGVVTIRVLDVTHPQWRDVVIQRYPIRTNTLPVNFAFDVDPSLVRPDHRYAVDAHLYVPAGHFHAVPQPLPALSGTVSARLVLQGGEQWQDPGQWYRQHLGREATPGELSAWRDAMERGESPEEIEAQILGGRESHDRRGGDYRDVIRDSLRAGGQTQPAPADVDRYQNQLEQAGQESRAAVLQRILQEMRQRQQRNP
jgi:hypothetical protein